MKDYKEKLKLTRVIFAIAALIILTFSVLAILSECGVIRITPLTGDEHWHSLWRGFICGASIGITAYIILGLVRIFKAIHNEKKLKELYIQENDERQHQIWTSARALSMQIFLTFGFVAGIVLGYFNVTVSITVLSCVTVHALIGILCKLYYSRKY